MVRHAVILAIVPIEAVVIAVTTASSTMSTFGKQKSLLAFACTLGWNDIYVYPRWESELRLGAKLNAEYISKLENIIGEVIKPERKEIAVSWDLVADKFDEFAALMKWLSEKLSAKMTSV